MIVTSTFNNLEFDNVAEALIKQHALNNVAKEDFTGQRKGKGKGKWRPRAYLAERKLGSTMILRAGRIMAKTKIGMEPGTIGKKIPQMHGLQMTAKKIGGMMDTTPGSTRPI